MKSDTCLFCDLLPSPWVHLILTSESTNCCQHPKRATTTGVQLHFIPSVFRACHKLLCMSRSSIHNGRGGNRTGGGGGEQYHLNTSQDYGRLKLYQHATRFLFFFCCCCDCCSDYTLAKSTLLIGI